jgi:MFS transporter, SHS family, sialic acid transporter
MGTNTSNPALTVPIQAAAPLSTAGRWRILVVAFLGWLCAGMYMSITQLTGQAAAINLLERVGSLDAARFQVLNKEVQAKDATRSLPQRLSESDRAQIVQWKGLVGRWFAWYQCAFLFGAAAGGLCFGWLGDRLGRSKGMALSILTYSGMAAAAALAQSPVHLLVLWFLACTGVGGMWPNGVALVSEAWSGLSRPMVAGVIGTAANIGLFLMATIASQIRITPEEWRWVMGVGASPLVLGLFALAAVPESPRWLAARVEQQARQQAPTPTWEVFQPPCLGITLVGILLATIPLIGGWGSANWMIPWAGEAGEAASPPDPFLKARVGQARAVPGIVSSLLGGWIASLVGRRLTYFLVSLAALVLAQYTFWFGFPTDRDFLIWVGALGFVSGIYFGWLPLFLPELFPTRVRSTGAGVSFNFGRIVTAVTVFASGILMNVFDGDYARIGRVTSLIFAVGMIAACFAPDTSRKDLRD